jgi:uncharacterized damage-inducible protein DinB
MRLDHLRELYRYNDWATAQVLTRLRTVPPEVFVRDLGSSFASLRDTFAHLVMAEWIWLERWHGHNPTAPPPWATSPDLAVLEAALQDVAQRRVAYLATLAEASLDAVLHFHLLSGSPEHHVLYDLLVHVVNHSTYHRGQLITLLRQVGAEGVATDLIVFKKAMRGEGP